MSLSQNNGRKHVRNFQQRKLSYSHKSYNNNGSYGNCPPKNPYIPHKNHVYQKKYRYHDDNGKQLTAGGILPYDDNGIWVIAEKKKNGEIEWTDPGGKYKVEDCDIYTTIAREFCEEVYHSDSLSRKDILSLSEKNTPTYVNGHMNLPVYVCYIVHTDELKKYGVNLDPVKFLQCRNEALKHNPGVPDECFSSIELRYISFRDVEKSMHSVNGPYNLSYRLRRILRYSRLVTFIYTDRSITPDLHEKIPSDLEEEENNSNTAEKSSECIDIQPTPCNSSSSLCDEFEKVVNITVT